MRSHHVYQTPPTMKLFQHLLAKTFLLTLPLASSCSYSFPPPSKETDSLLESIGRTGTIPADNIPQLKKRALESGDAHSSYALHQHFQSMSNNDESLAWLRLAALQGNPNAMQSLSAYLAHREVHPAQRLEAAHWGLLAADCGCKVARELKGIGERFNPPTRLHGR